MLHAKGWHVKISFRPGLAPVEAKMSSASCMHAAKACIDVSLHGSLRPMHGGGMPGIPYT